MGDIRYASDRGKFAESFVKLGIVPGDGGAWLLQRVVGVSKACEMSFTGDMLDADAALAAGLVSRLLPQAPLPPEAPALPARHPTHPPHATQLPTRPTPQPPTH